MEIGVSEEVFERFPGASIGYVIAEVEVKDSDPYVEELKANLKVDLEPTTFVTHPSIARWRELYRTEFRSKLKSSVEALVARVVRKKKMWTINSVVDFYNCFSVESLLPMGGYDLAKIEGPIWIRYGKEGETFLPLGSREEISVSSEQVVYADEKKLLCWLWNHKDSRLSSIDETTKEVIFFMDFLGEPDRQAINSFCERLKKLGCQPKAWGLLSKESPQVSL